MNYTIEKLFHFRCSDCNGWWTIGDAPTDRGYYCPWCGKLHPVLGGRIVYVASSGSTTNPVPYTETQDGRDD